MYWKEKQWVSVLHSIFAFSPFLKGVFLLVSSWIRCVACTGYFCTQWRLSFMWSTTTNTCVNHFCFDKSTGTILCNYMRFILCPMQCGYAKGNSTKILFSISFYFILLGFSVPIAHYSEYTHTHDRLLTFFGVMLYIVRLNVFYSKQLKLRLENYAFLSTVVTVKISLDFT